jgi:hypothetical protein
VVARPPVGDAGAAAEADLAVDGEQLAVGAVVVPLDRRPGDRLVPDDAPAGGDERGEDLLRHEEVAERVEHELTETPALGGSWPGLLRLEGLPLAELVAWIGDATTGDFAVRAAVVAVGNLVRAAARAGPGLGRDEVGEPVREAVADGNSRVGVEGADEVSAAAANDEHLAGAEHVDRPGVEVRPVGEHVSSGEVRVQLVVAGVRIVDVERLDAARPVDARAREHAKSDRLTGAPAFRREYLFT